MAANSSDTTFLLTIVGKLFTASQLYSRYPNLTMAAPTFPRFLELPKELQIQIWEHAIVDTIIMRPRDQSDFGKVMSTTFSMISRPPLQTLWGFVPSTVGINRALKLSTEPTTLPIPSFVPIMGVCRFAELVACQWWLRVLKGSSVGSRVLDCAPYWEDVRRKDVKSLIGHRWVDSRARARGDRGIGSKDDYGLPTYIFHQYFQFSIYIAPCSIHHASTPDSSSKIKPR